MKKLAVVAVLMVAMLVPRAALGAQLEDMGTVILRKDAVERSGKRKRDDQTINEAVDRAFDGDPQGAWNTIRHSSIDGREKLELFKLFREVFPDFEK